MLDEGWGLCDSEGRDPPEQLLTQTGRLTCGQGPRTEASPPIGLSVLDAGEVTYPRLVSSACLWSARRFKRTVFGVSHWTCPHWLLRTRSQGCRGEGSMGCVGVGASLQ